MAKASTEDYRRIDIRDWNRRGFLSEGTRHWRWVNGERTVTPILTETQPHRLLMCYKVLGPGGQWDQIDEPISFDRTHGGPGWKRCWFLCPGCDRRVAILYFRRYFRCRQCFGLGYPSQRVTRSQRALRRSREIGW